MAGTLVVDVGASFAQCILMGVTPRMEFDRPDIQATDANGVPKWEASVAVTYTADRPGQRTQSEVLAVGITSSDDPGAGVQLGPCVLDGLRVGVSTPEAKDSGRVRGGRMWYSAAGVRSAVPARSRGES